MRVVQAVILLSFTALPAHSQQGAPGGAATRTRAAIARIEALNPRLNAVIAIDPTALAQADALDRATGPSGPLFGVPILVKDNIETQGPLPTTAGSLALARNVTGHDAPLVARLRGAGAVILGKANLSEWANMRSGASLSGWSAIGGQTRNPHALDRTPCGSSSGSAAAVAAGMVDVAIGTETDGSIVCPAAITGVVGIKPTVGLVSRHRIVPISLSQDTPGPIARDVATAARVLAAMAGSDPADPATRQADARRTDYAAALDPAALKNVRIGVLRFVTGWSAPVDAAFDAALGVLRAQGATLVDIAALPDREKIGPAEFTVLLTEFKAGLNAYLATTPASVETRTLADVIAFNRAHGARELGLFGQDVFERAQATQGIADPAYLAARALSLRLAGKDGIDALIARHNVTALVGPTEPPAWAIDPANGDQYSGGGAGTLAAVAGYPHLTVPMGMVKGLPVGLSFIGPAWSEARLIGLAYAYEQARGPMPAPAMLRTIDERPEVAPLMGPWKDVAH
jgi:amidase